MRLTPEHVEVCALDFHADRLRAALREVGIVVAEIPAVGRPDADAALEWALAWPDYGETFSTLSEAEQKRFRAAALSASAESPMDWWFAINYFIGDKPER